MDTLELTREATAARQKIDEGRRQLVRAVRQASREGLSQRAIAQATGTSQPEISRLLRFHGTSSHSRSLRKHRAEVLTYLKSRGLKMSGFLVLLRPVTTLKNQISICS